MRNRFLIFFLSFFCFLYMPAAKRLRSVDSLHQNAILGQYLQKLNSLSHKRLQMPEQPAFSPFYYKAISPALLYRSALEQYFEIPATLTDSLVNYRPMSEHTRTDSILLLNEKINELLFYTYTTRPELLSSTEDKVHQEGMMQDDVNEHIGHETVLADQTDLPVFVPDIGDSVVVVAKKPNFWKFYSNSSLQFYQYYNTKNWFKDYTDNYYNMLAVLKLGVQYNNKRKFNWESNLEMRLGFRPYPKDKEHQFKTSEDLVRLNLKFGYKASKHWNYTFFAEGTTQMLRSYKDNSKEVRSDFMSPFTSVISFGMEYKLELKRFNCSANLSPIAYNFKSVARPELATTHGIKEHHTTYNKFGPFVNINYNWTIIDNIKWAGRIYWFSNLSMNTIEWENTFTFNVNKYISAKLFLYPRFDDSSPNYRSKKNNSFFMFKQWLSLGLDYNI